MDRRDFHTSLDQWSKMPGDLEEKEYFMSVYPAPLDVKFTTLSMLYLESGAQQKKAVTQFFASGSCADASSHSAYGRFDNALIYMRRIARCVRTTADGLPLRLGLAAAAYTEGQVDGHDLLVSLAFLYYAAARAGIDPVPYFNVVAVTAGPQAGEALRAFLHCEAATARRIVQHYEGTC